MDHGSGLGKRRHKPIEPPSPSSEEERGKASVFRRLGNPREMVRPVTHHHKTHDVSHNRVCRHWMAKGRCDFGGSCSFYHPPLPPVSVRSPHKKYSASNQQHQILQRDDYAVEADDASRIRSTVIVSRGESSSRKMRKVTIPEEETGERSKFEPIISSNPYDDDYESALDLERKRQEIQRRLSELNDDIPAENSPKKRSVARIQTRIISPVPSSATVMRTLPDRYYGEESGRNVVGQWNAEAGTSASSSSSFVKRQRNALKSVGIPATARQRSAKHASSSMSYSLMRKRRGLDKEEGELSDDPEKREARRLKRSEAQRVQTSPTAKRIDDYKETRKRPPKTPPLPPPVDGQPPSSPPMVKRVVEDYKEVKKRPPKTPPLPAPSPEIEENEPFVSRRTSHQPTAGSGSNKGSPRLPSALPSVDVRSHRKQRQRDRLRSVDRRIDPVPTDSLPDRRPARNVTPPPRRWPEMRADPAKNARSATKLRPHRRQQPLRVRPSAGIKPRPSAGAAGAVAAPLERNDWRQRRVFAGKPTDNADYIRRKYEQQYGPVSRRPFGRQPNDPSRKFPQLADRRMDRPAGETSPERRSLRDAAGSPKRWRESETDRGKIARPLKPRQQQRRLQPPSRSPAAATAVNKDRPSTTLNDRSDRRLRISASKTETEKRVELPEMESRKRKRVKTKKELVAKRSRLNGGGRSLSATGSGDKSKAVGKGGVKQRHSLTPADAKPPLKMSSSSPRHKKRSVEPPSSSTMVEAPATTRMTSADILSEEKAAEKSETIEHMDDNEKTAADDMPGDDFEPISDEEVLDDGENYAGGVGEQVDWSVLLTETTACKPKHSTVSQSSMDRFKPENFLLGLGLRKDLLGLELARQLEVVANSGRSADDDKPEFKILDGIATTTRSKLLYLANRLEILNDIGPYRKALSARTDLTIRRRLCGLHDEFYENLQSNDISMPYNAEAYVIAKNLFTKKRPSKPEAV